jgi:hypothetical protein
MKIVILVAFILIIASLGFALVYMMRDKDKGKANRMATALTFRVAFSIALFLFLLFAYKMGWIEPTGIIVGN